MNARLAIACLAISVLACTAKSESSARDSANRPDTAAIQGAGSAPHPTPAAADSASGDSAARVRRP